MGIFPPKDFGPPPPQKVYEISNRIFGPRPPPQSPTKLHIDICTLGTSIERLTLKKCA